jgi:hypothetical protein
MAVSEFPNTPTLRLAAVLVAQVQRADQRRGGLINHPLLRTAGEFAQALAQIREDPRERRG